MNKALDERGNAGRFRSIIADFHFSSPAPSDDKCQKWLQHGLCQLLIFLFLSFDQVCN